MLFLMVQLSPRSTRTDTPVPYSPLFRSAIVAAFRCVYEVFLEESLDLKRQYIVEYRADVLAMGDDWAGKFDHLSDACRVVYFERTPAISTTAVIEKIRI